MNDKKNRETHPCGSRLLINPMNIHLSKKVSRLKKSEQKYATAVAADYEIMVSN